MSRNKKIYTLVALAILIISGPTIGSIVATRAAASTSALPITSDAVDAEAYTRGLALEYATGTRYGLPSNMSMTDVSNLSDYYQRHPRTAIGIEAVTSDWFERHPEMVNATNTADLSDYFERHPGVTIGIAAAASDWFERHPEMVNATNTADLSDYYQRHPRTAIGIAAAASDWFERHPEMVNATNAVDLSDYFQRHPTLLKPGGDLGANETKSQETV